VNVKEFPVEDTSASVGLTDIVPDPSATEVSPIKNRPTKRAIMNTAIEAQRMEGIFFDIFLSTKKNEKPY
jgi:hypothetical protein